MSRVAKKPIALGKGVEFTATADQLTVKGPKGALSMARPQGVETKIEDGHLVLSAEGDRIAMAGTTRAILANMVKGVSGGFERKLELVGVGYRAAMQGKDLNLSLGFSHPVVKEMPAGIKVETPTQTEILIKGSDRQVVGQIAAEVRAIRPPEPYKGKGIRYSDERVVLKETKKK